MTTTIGSGITIGAGIAAEKAPLLLLSLDAADYTSGAWVDSVGSRSFTLYGGASYSSDGGGSISFDPSSGQYAECTSSLSSQSTWTIEAWHYYSGQHAGVDSGGYGACIVTEKFTGTVLNYSLGNNLASGPGPINDLYSGFFNGAWRNTVAGINLAYPAWYQIIGTYDGKNIKLYINNALVSSVNYVGTPTSSGAGIRLMRRWDNADYWGGKLAIVRIYGGAMSAPRVSANWFANKARFGL